MSTINQVYSDPQGKNAGIDVGKSQLDICIHECGMHWSTSNDASAIKALLNKEIAWVDERLAKAPPRRSRSGSRPMSCSGVKNFDQDERDVRPVTVRTVRILEEA